MELTRDRLGFYLQSAEMVNHYQAVWSHLPAGAFDVVVHEQTSDHHRERIYARCGALGIDVQEGAAVIASGERYDVLVSHHPVAMDRGKQIVQRVGRRNVRFMYALGKAGWNFSPWNRIYDIILCFGPYQVDQLQFCEGSLLMQMGYPRFDSFYNVPIDREAELRARGADPSKQTVVWLPTWSRLSSIDAYAETMSRLTADYNVLLKVHPLSVESEPQRMERLRGLPFTQFIDEPEDNVPLYQLADFVVCDYGGPPFGAIYVDRNLLLLNVDGAVEDDVTGAQSPDIQIRGAIQSIQPGEAPSIAATLRDDSIWQAQKGLRFALRKALFAPFHGFSARVAAEILMRSDTLLETIPGKHRRW